MCSVISDEEYSKRETSEMRPRAESSAFSIGFLFGLFLNPEDGGNAFLQMDTELPLYYTILDCRRQQSLQSTGVRKVYNQ